ncbi:MAG TPA: cysteine desulfurase family protein [Vicinamibacterales bacterium]|nr:cysteine desulfurase family protein [Vicinamibacterales bacterium]
MDRRIYLDHHATTPVDPAVLEAMLPYFTERYGNPSSRQHGFGQEAAAAVEEARAAVAALIGARPEDVVFTSGATESDNLAVRGAARARSEKGRHVVTTAIEHSAVLEPCRTLEREGFTVARVPVDATGVVEASQVIAALRPDTVLVSVMAANNEVGTVQPLAEIGRACQERGILFHTDAVQAVGRMPVDVEAMGADLLSLSAHKMYGPKGVGALYVRRDRRPRIKLQPQNEGGGQEKGLRSGTLNVPGIVGLGAAAGRAGEALAGGEPARLAGLRDRLLAGLRARIDGVEVNGALAPRLPGNLHVSIAGAEAETLILSLGGRIAISSGAACAEAGGKGSHVLRAMGLSDERVYTAVRFGVGRYNSAADIDDTVSAIGRAVIESRARSSPARA